MTDEYGDVIMSPKDIAHHFIKRVKQDKDACVGITGDEGDGKSTLAVWIIIECLKKQGKTDEEIKQILNDYIVYSPNKDEMMAKIVGLPKYSPISADEAIKILYKMNWATDIQKFLNMLYAVCRQENKISLLCMPRFIDFNEFFRNHRIKFWIHIISRGHAVFFIRDWSPFSKDPWWIQDSQKTIDMHYKSKKLKIVDFNDEEMIFLLKKAKIFVGEIMFDDLPADIQEIYKSGKKSGGYENLADQLSFGGTGKRSVLEVKLVNTYDALLKDGYTEAEALGIVNSSKHDMVQMISNTRAEGKCPIPLKRKHKSYSVKPVNEPLTESIIDINANSK